MGFRRRDRDRVSVDIDRDTSGDDPRDQADFGDGNGFGDPLGNHDLLDNAFHSGCLDRGLFDDDFVFEDFLLDRNGSDDLFGDVFDFLLGDPFGQRFGDGLRDHHLFLDRDCFLDLDGDLLSDDLVFVAGGRHGSLLLDDFALHSGRGHGDLLLKHFGLHLLDRHGDLLLQVLGLHTGRGDWYLDVLGLGHQARLGDGDLLVVRLVVGRGGGLTWGRIRDPVQAPLLVDRLTGLWVDAVGRLGPAQVVSDISGLVVVLSHVATGVDRRGLVSRHGHHRGDGLGLHDRLGHGPLDSDGLGLHRRFVDGSLNGVLLGLVSRLGDGFLHQEVLNSDLRFGDRFLDGGVLSLVLRLGDLFVACDGLFDLRGLGHEGRLIGVLDLGDGLEDRVRLVDGRGFDDRSSDRHGFAFDARLGDGSIADDLPFDHHILVLDLVPGHRDLIVDRFGLQSVADRRDARTARCTVLCKGVACSKAQAQG